MSRPPRPISQRSPGASGLAGDASRLDYLPLGYADLLALEEELAVTEPGRPRRAGLEPEEGDAGRAIMELSALLGHVLAVYQRTYAREAFISTAQSAAGLVRHARRLAYDPSPGLAANGHVVLTAKEGTSGTVAAGLALSSVPLGEIAAQDYETDEDLVVDAQLNELAPANATVAATVATGDEQLRLAGRGHGLEPGDSVALVGPQWRGFFVTGVSEAEDGSDTVVAVDRSIGKAFDPETTDSEPRLLAHPRVRARPFGADADPGLFPPSAVKAATGTKPGAGPYPIWWYEAQRADTTGYAAQDVYLAETLDEALTDTHVMRSTGTAFGVFRVVQQIGASVTLRREDQFSYEKLKGVSAQGSDGAWTSEAVSYSPKQFVTQIAGSSTSGSVTAIRVQDMSGATVDRAAHAMPADWLADWAVDVPLARRRPNGDPLRSSFELPGLLDALRPGRPLVLANRAGSVAQVVVVRRAERHEDRDVTEVWWDPVGPGPEEGFALGDLKVYGNVARLSHGRTISETAGGSDGVTPFQRFPLKKWPVTVLPGVSGGEPELEVRVDDVLWQRVADFGASRADDRHYRSETDEDGVTTIVFGDGRNGAVPPSGTKNVRAVYRVGLGVEGDVEAGRLTRLKRAHPLLDSVRNLSDVGGGAEPAGADEIRAQATRWIRTFDRAVSVSDLADLALLMPGVARSAARWDQAEGAVVVVATASGEAPPAMDAVRAFLDARRDVTVPMTLKPPRACDVRLAVTLEPDPAFHVELVKEAVRTALHGESEDDPGLFTFRARGLGQPAYLSEVYARLEALPGVVGVQVTEFEARGELRADVIPAEVDEWLSLPPNELTVTALGAGGPT